MSGRGGAFAGLVAIGACWGLTMPLTKTAVSTGHQHLGLIFWQLLIGLLVLGGLTLLRGKGLPMRRAHLGLYVMIAFLGTILPNSASYTAAAHLPAGIMAIVVSLVPMMAFPVAMALGMDRFSARRLAGLALGLCAIVLIALPETSLPDPAMVAWLPLALIAPAFYALEGNLVARIGTFGLDPVQVLAGACAVGLVFVTPAMLATGTFVDPRPGAAPEWAILGIGLAHALAYAGYVWLVGQAGAVFAAQVAYLVTGFGIGWSALFLGESYSVWVWGALAVMFVGLSLVQPRPPAGQGEARSH